jgi:predicted TIM-barrel fold metal-dependent hydrolase
MRLARHTAYPGANPVALPDGVGIVDLMIGFPMRDKHKVYEYLMRGIRDEESKTEFTFPAEYMFKDVPDENAEGADPIDTTFAEMDKYGVHAGLFGLNDDAREAARRYPGRVFYSIEVDPNDVMKTVRRIRAAKEEHDLTAVTLFPSGCFPQVNVDAALVYPVYATCIELDIPIIVNAGIAGPRFPSDCQHVERFDRVMYDFPELTFVTRHGCEPWQDLAVKLMLKWPGLHYSTSAFAPKFYPKDVIHFANTRGADKVMYAGYFPMGLSLDRIFEEMPDVPFRDHVWPKFLRENAVSVFKLDR